MIWIISQKISQKVRADKSFFMDFIDRKKLLKMHIKEHPKNMHIVL
jgi:hypothetical protein